MAQNISLKKNSVLFWLVALLASGIIAIGSRFIYAPADAAADFGVQTGNSQNLAYLWAKGTRDIVSGLLGFALLACRVSRRVLAVFLAVVALIPLGDSINLYVNIGADNPIALSIHAGTAVFMLILSMFLWKGPREAPRANSSSIEPGGFGIPAKADRFPK